jgi:hypothetical protein
MAEKPIRIHRLIVHKVDHKRYDEPLLSDLETPYSDEVASFLRQHIRSNREHRYSRTGAFLSKVSQDAPALASAADTLLEKPEQFVSRSREIAVHLFNSLDKRTSPGDLVVCTFSEADASEEPWLALLKMDPSDGFVGDRQRVDGKWRVVLRRVPNVLPSGELQKCAFILPPTVREAAGYDLIVLDQQTARYRIQRPVASFFSQAFLQCRVNLNREDQTIIFVNGSRNWLSRREPEWDEADIRQFHTQLNTTLQNQMVDVTAFADAVIPRLEEQERYLTYMKGFGLTDLAFQPDPKRRKQLVEYATFEGDDDLRVRIRADAVGEGGTLQFHRDPATSEWVIEIRTTVWRRK